MVNKPYLKLYEVSWCPKPPAIGTTREDRVYASNEDGAYARLESQAFMFHGCHEVTGDFWLEIYANRCLKPANDYRQMWVFGADRNEFIKATACKRKVGHRGACSVFEKRATVVNGRVVELMHISPAALKDLDLIERSLVDGI